MSEERIQKMRGRLTERFPDAVMDIEDESHLHAGHAGARSGRGHFKLTISAADLAGMSMIARHRAVYEALGDMMQTDIHALSISASGH